MIRRAKINPNSIVVSLDVMCSNCSEEVKAIEGVNIIVGTDQRRTIELIHRFEEEEMTVNADDIMNVKTFEELSVHQ